MPVSRANYAENMRTNMESLMGYALCAGIVYLVWKWRKKKKGSLSESNPKSNSDFNYAISIATGDRAEQRISSLHREATDLKSKGDFERAIQCLREAEILKKDTKTIYPIKHSLRLPLFLQQSGNFDEAMFEFQKLIDGTEKEFLNGCQSGVLLQRKCSWKLIYTKYMGVWLRHVSAKNGRI